MEENPGKKRAGVLLLIFSATLAVSIFSSMGEQEAPSRLLLYMKIATDIGLGLGVITNLFKLLSEN